MAKVDRILTKFQGIHQCYEVHFTKSSGFFIKDCPHEITVYGNFINSKETLIQIKDSFLSAITKAEDAMQISRKIILVQFTVTSDMIFKHNGYIKSLDKTNPLSKFKGRSFNDLPGLGFAIDYRLATEVERGAEKVYFHPLSESTDSRARHNQLSKADNEIIIPYSEESIQTLEHIKEQMKNMIYKIGNFFQDAEKLQAALESGNLKMLNE